MDIEYILNEVERERRKFSIYKLYKEFLTRDGKISGKSTASTSLLALAPSMFEELVDLFQYVQDTGSEDEFDLQNKGKFGRDFITDIRDFLKNKYQYSGSVTQNIIKKYLSIDPSEASEFYCKKFTSLQRNWKEIFPGSFKEALENPSIELVNLIKEVMARSAYTTEECIDTFLQTKESSEISSIDILQDEADYFLPFLDYINEHGTDAVSKYLRSILIEDGENDLEVSSSAAKLRYLAHYNPIDALELIEVGMQSQWYEVRKNSIESLVQVVGTLVKINPMKVSELYRKGMNDIDPVVYEPTGLGLGWLAMTLSEKILVPIEDAAYKFLNKYLNSKYVKTKKGQYRSGKRVLRKLKKLVQNPDRDYQKLTRILEEGKVGNLVEIVECSSVNHPDFIAIQRLGSGKFGITYLMQNIGAERKLHAFKTINPEQEDTINLEARVHNTIGKRHENLAEMYAVVTVEIDGKKTKAIDMEYIKGKTLREILDEKGRLDPKTAVEYGLNILNGLSYLHSKGIHHRDLKPDNIMIDEDNIGKVIDFGLSKTSEITSQPFMNRAYAPPEFYLGKEYNNSDVWSFGLVLYEMIICEHLFTPSSFNTYFKNYVAGKVSDIVQFQKEIGQYYKGRIANVRKLASPRLAKIIEKCIKVNHKERYQSVDELAKDLNYALEGRTMRYYKYTAGRFKSGINYISEINSRKIQNFVNNVFSVGKLAIGGSLFILVTITAITIALGIRECINSGVVEFVGKRKETMEFLDKVNKDLEERQKNPHELNDISLENLEEFVAYEPVELKAYGVNITFEDVHWIISGIDEKKGYHDELFRFNSKETKFAFINPGNYTIECLNLFYGSPYGNPDEVPNRHREKVRIIVNPRKETPNNLLPEVNVKYPLWWVENNQEFIIDASESRDLDGHITKYFIWFGDGNNKEGEVNQKEDLIFKHAYTAKAIGFSSDTPWNPTNFHLILYDDKGGVADSTGIIYYLSEFSKRNGFLDSSNNRISPEEWLMKQYGLKPPQDLKK